MTTKEAIGRIQEHIHIHSKKEPFTPFLDEAFNMAIEALKTCEECMWYKERPHVKWQYEKLRPHGEWQYEKLGYLSTHNCSRCGGAGNHLWKFCPFCGAYMRPKEGETK